MNRDALRKETCIIIRKHGEYLVGSVLYSEDLRWSGSMYDAWRTRDREEARDVARETGGVLVLFNPIIGKTRLI